MVLIDETRYWKVGLEQEIERIGNMAMPVGLDAFANYGVFDFNIENHSVLLKGWPVPEGSLDRDIRIGLAGVRIRL